VNRPARRPAPLRAVVCGTRFGQFYLAAVAGLSAEIELAGILSRGSPQSEECARRAGVPLFTDPAQLPEDVDIACVVVRSGAVGGAGSDLALQLLSRGIHVLQEQPVHHDDVVACLQAARAHDVVYQLGDLYVHLPPVRRFVATARALLARRQALHVHAACAIQVAFPLFHILGDALGTVRPWALTAAPEADGPYSVLTGRIGGVPAAVQVHHEMDPGDPDNHLSLLHQITIDTAAGRLMLADTHGPTSWVPRLHIPETVRGAFDFEDETAAHLNEPSLIPLDAAPPSYRRILSTWWPAAIGGDLRIMLSRILGRTGTGPSGQYHLTLCRLWQDATRQLGYPALRPFQAHQPLPAAELVTAAKEADVAGGTGSERPPAGLGRPAVTCGAQDAS
jgi:thiazolinyl imide reductase